MDVLGFSIMGLGAIILLWSIQATLAQIADELKTIRKGMEDGTN